MAPAKTGRERRSKIVVILTDQTKRGIRSNSIARQRILTAVVMKLMDARIEDTPAKWREKIARSTEAPL